MGAGADGGALIARHTPEWRPNLEAMAEVEREFTICNRLGLHARAAAAFVKTAGAFEADIQVSKDSVEVNGKSIMGIMMLAAPQGSRIRVVCSGADATACLDALEQLIADRFGEAD